MTDVLISYSRRDDAFVRELHSRLTGAGRDVWVDWEDIPAAAKWQQNIDESIDAAESLVFVISPSSLESEYCAAEVRHAEERGKRIVPIAIDGAKPEDAPTAVRELNWIWCREDDDREAAFAALEKALDTDLDWARAHTRLLVRAVEWDARGDGSLLLRGKDLAEVERVLAAHAGKDPRPTELQERYVHESRRGARRRQRALLSGVTVALAVAIVLGVLALLQRNDARRATRSATSVALAATANDRVETRPDQALLLALAASTSSESADARNAAFTALQAARELGVTRFVHGGSEVRDLAFAPDGALAVGSANGLVRLVDLSRREDVATFASEGSGIVGVDVVRDGKTIAAGSADGTVRLWDIQSGQPIAVFRAGRRILASAVSRDGRSVAAMDGEGHVWLWNVANGRVRRLDGPPGEEAVLAFSPDGRTLAAGANELIVRAEGTVRLWDVASGKLRGDLPSGDAVTGLAFAPDSRTLATGGYVDDPYDAPGTLRLWSTRRLRQLSRLESKAWVLSIAVDRDGQTMVAGFDDGSIRRVAVDELSWEGQPLRAFPTGVSRLALSPDGKSVAAAAQGTTTARVWNVEDPAPFGRVIARMHGSSATAHGLAFSPDGRRIAAADGDKGALVVPIGSGAPTEPRWLAPPGSGLSVEGVAFGRDGSILATVETPSLSPERWNLSTHERLSPGAKGSSLLADPLEKLAAAGGRHGVNNVTSAAVAADGHTFAIGDSHGRVWIWDSRSGARAGVLGADADVDEDLTLTPELAFSPDASMLAVESDERGVQLWDVRARRPLGRPLAHTAEGVSGLAFSRDGRTLASAQFSVMRLWQRVLWRDLADLRAQICGLVVGDLTRDEWAAIAPGLAYRRTC